MNTNTTQSTTQNTQLPIILHGGYFEKYALADAQTMQMITPFIFDQCIPCLEMEGENQPFALVAINKQWLLINAAGEIIQTLPYETIQTSEDSSLEEWLGSDTRLTVYNGEKWGIINSLGKEVVPCMYDFVRIDYDMMMARKNNSWALLDNTGKELTAFKYGFIRNIGQLAIFQQGKAWGVLDRKTGKEIVPAIYDEIACVERNNLIGVQKDSKVGFINTLGEVVIPIIYEGADNLWFYEGYAIVAKDGKYGVIDTTGKEVVPFIYDYIRNSLTDDFWHVEKDGKWGFANRNGQEIIHCIYEQVNSFGNGLAPVKQNGLWGYIDTTGTMVIPCQYTEAGSFYKGVATVERDGKELIIDPTGKELLPPHNYDELEFIAWEPAPHMVKKDGLYGFLDANFQEIIPCMYEDTSGFYEDFHGFAAVQKDGKWGLIDATGKTIIPCEHPYRMVPLSHFIQNHPDTPHLFVFIREDGTWYVENV